MTQTIEAIYEAGKFRLLQPIALSEGQRVTLAIETNEEAASVRAALGDLVVHWPDTTDNSDAYLEAMADEIDHAFQGDKPLSQLIIEAREER